MPKPSLPETPEAFSLFGDPLNPQPPRPEVVEKQKTLYEKALKDWEKNPNDADAIIWLGRRTAYLGRIREAAAIFSRGIELHPEDPRMYRHRGHRFISLRLFDQAIDDLEKAAELIEGTPDEIELDGIPNERGVPVSSLHFNVWYHLALAYYLIGDYESALSCYEDCLKVSEIPDKLVATIHWTYMTLRLLERKDEADELIAPVTEDMDIIENQHYHRLLLMYKGVVTPEEVMKEARKQGPLAVATVGYGVGNWYLYNEREEKAVEVYNEILDTGGWAGFGYIAAEADLKWLSLPQD
ncbi:MAG: tetratricopeptide repeat protein [Candidatus Bathyarchaeota archaeon]|nr:tetratricopeptide repeat protein [Candidatus Bathyarchaeota archaeon]